MFRFIDNCRLKDGERTGGDITLDEYSDTETRFVVTIQREMFPDEIGKLKAYQLFRTPSKLCGRANTRLQNSDYLSYGSRFPIILPRRNHLVKLIILNYHQRDGHAMDTNHTLAALSEK